MSVFSEMAERQKKGSRDPCGAQSGEVAGHKGHVRKLIQRHGGTMAKSCKQHWKAKGYMPETTVSSGAQQAPWKLNIFPKGRFRPSQ